MALKFGAMAAMRTSAQPRPRKIRGLDAEQRREQRREQLLWRRSSCSPATGTPTRGSRRSPDRVCRQQSVLRPVRQQGRLLIWRCCARSPNALKSKWRKRCGSRPTPTKKKPCVGFLAAFAHTLVDDPRVAMVTFGAAAGISPRVEAQRRENRRWAASFIESLWRRNHPSGEINYHALAVATVGGLFETVTDFLHETDPPRPRTFDDLISDLTTFMSVVEAANSGKRRLIAAVT